MSFISELVLKCIAKDIPLPAIETLNKRKDLPRRYWIFYDIFFCDGLQKRQYVKKVINQKECETELRFGTCSFEAHVHSVIEQNYFVWIYDILTDLILDIGNDSLLSFKTEYDIGVTIENKERSVCSLYQPKEIEVSYSEEK